MTCHFDWLSETTNSFIQSLINENNFDLFMFDMWVRENNIQFKSNPNTYIQKIFKQELDKGTFTSPEVKKALAEKKNFNLILLFNDFRKNNITINKFDDIYLECLIAYLIQFEILDGDQLREIAPKIISYLLEQDKKDSSSFIDCLKKSRALKGKQIDYDRIQSKYESERNSWIEILSKLDSLENKL